MAHRKSLPTFGWKVFLLIVVAMSGLLIKVTYASSWTLVYSEEFSGSSLNTSAWSIKSGTEGHHQAVYSANNVSVHDGMLDLLTQRHCVPSGGSVSPSNANSSVCPSGTSTVYSSGKVISKNRWASGKIEIRASLPSTQKGLWPALWMRNPPSWGSADYGELDIMEWYGDQPSIHTSTSIMGAGAVKAHHNKNTASDLSTNGPHTYVMEWSPSGITYYFNGSKLNASPDVSTNFSGISASLFSQIMNNTWELRMETEVTKSGDQWHAAPDNNASFTPAHFYIDSVKVYAAAEEPPTPSPTPSPSATTPTSTNPSTPSANANTAGQPNSTTNNGSTTNSSAGGQESVAVALDPAPTVLSDGTSAVKVEYFLNGTKIATTLPGAAAPTITKQMLQPGSNELKIVVTNAAGKTETTFQTVYGAATRPTLLRVVVTSVAIAVASGGVFWLLWHFVLRHRLHFLHNFWLHARRT